ncbi:hypothetical protein [Enterobacter ludwigii]|uniref:hypothetical protein n=1 Tax=Enterobacter ludwigii TaxID=299767 RepID=UPI002A218CDD|nr:hypothetical protein [Enterobacter ludwigii]EKS7208135.1 hypothetical protein [Enterobacter ludwigii]
MKNNDFNILFEELLEEIEEVIAKVKASTHFGHCSGEERVRKLEEEAYTIITKYQNGRILTDKYVYREYTIDEYISSKESAGTWMSDPSKLLEGAFVSQKWGIYQYSQGYKAKGRKHVLVALKMFNMWIGACWAIDMLAAKEQSNEIKREAASLGGKNRAQNYRRVKDEVIRLLKKNMPDKGWRSKVSAINAIETELTKFIELDYNKKSDWTSWEKLLKTINDWSRNDTEMKETFSMVVRK